MRQLVGSDRPRTARAEWFPKGVGGELDVIERLRDWADDPAVSEMVIVDPFLSSASLTRLVRRIARHDLSLVVLSSVIAENPDEFGTDADAVKLLRDALDAHASEFACQLRVINLVEGAGPPDDMRAVGQAFHDRYIRVTFGNGVRRTHLLTNSLNKAAGNWPFALAELPANVSAQVNAYIDGLIDHVDLAVGLRLLATLTWTNTPNSRAGGISQAPRIPLSLGPQLTRDVVRTFAWLRGSTGWANVRWPLSRTDSRRELTSSVRARLLHPIGRCLRVRDREVEEALRKQITRRPPRNAQELAILLRGFGEMCAWSEVSLNQVGQALKSASIRRNLPDALRLVETSVCLRREGSGEMEQESLLTLPLGRRLLLKTEAAIDEPWAARSPEYGLTGALVVGFTIDARATLAFLDATPSQALREVGHAEVLKDLSPFRRPRTFPALLRARQLAARVAGVLHLFAPRSEGGAGFDLSAADGVLEDAGWPLHDRAWGMAIGFERATMRLRQMRHRSGVSAQFFAEAEADAGRGAEAVARAWPSPPTPELLNAVCGILDERGEDVVLLASAIASAGRDASSLWRRCLGRLDAAFQLSAFDAPDSVVVDRELVEYGFDPGVAQDMTLWAAISYARLTGSKSLTTLASRYKLLLGHCEGQLRDPLFRYFRADDWHDRIARLAAVYLFVYRILDEASRAGQTKGVAFFANDVGIRVDALLDLADDENHGLQGELALLARDRGRHHLSGLAALGATPPKLVTAYLQAQQAAGQSTPSFTPLEAMLAVGVRPHPAENRPLLAALNDVLEGYLIRQQSVSAVDSWWRQLTARPEQLRLRGWSSFVSDYALNRSSPHHSGVTEAEKGLGFRLGPS